MILKYHHDIVSYISYYKDGDQCSVKGIYSVEANEELLKFMNSKQNFLDLGGINIRISSNEAVQSLYSMTKVLPETEKRLTYPTY